MVNQDLLDLLVLQENVVSLEQGDSLGHKGLVVKEDLLVKEGNQVQKGHQDHLDQLVHLDREEREANLDPLVR